VSASAPEILQLADHIRQTFTADQLAALKERLASLDLKTRGMNTLERVRPDLPCALLVDGRCSAYEARPLACMGWNSYDAAGCERALSNPLTSVRAYSLAIFVFDAVRRGIQQGVGQAGLSGASLELTAALRVALDLPDATERYLAKEPIFAEARAPRPPKGFSPVCLPSADLPA
jgi:hypothetical protein